MPYVDGYVLAVPTKNLRAYKKMAITGGKIWRRHGALDYKECMADDMKVEKGLMSFPKLIKLKKGETVIFAYIVYKSRKHRDEVNAKVFKDPAMDAKQFENVPMPFEMKRMAYGGFEV